MGVPHGCAGAERIDAVLSTSAEECLKAAVYDGAYSGSGQAGPAQVLLGFLQQPFTDLRIATYRHSPSLYTTVTPPMIPQCDLYTYNAQLLQHLQLSINDASNTF